MVFLFVLTVSGHKKAPGVSGGVQVFGCMGYCFPTLFVPKNSGKLSGGGGWVECSLIYQFPVMESFAALTGREGADLDKTPTIHLYVST